MFYSNELYHHGIKGQRWGVRRYRNADGSLTEAGKRRIQNTDPNKLRKDFQKQVNKARKKQHGSSNRWMAGLEIGENSKVAISRRDQQLKKIYDPNSKANKELDKVLRKLDSDYEKGKIDVDEYDKQYGEATSRFREQTQLGKYQAAKVGGKFLDDYLDNAGKDVTVGYLMDLGYDRQGAEFINEQLRRGKQALW